MPVSGELLWTPARRPRRGGRAHPLPGAAGEERRAGASPTIPRCTPGRSNIAPSSGPRSGTSAASWRRRGTRRAGRRRSHAGRPPTPARGTRWFPEARLNFAENLLRKSGDEPALDLSRRGPRAGRRGAGTSSRARWRACAAFLRERGVRPGIASRAGCPTVRDAIARCSRARASARSGRRARPTSASQGVLDRFGQIEPSVLFAADGYVYGGKRIDTLALDVLAGMPSRAAVACRAVRDVLVPWASPIRRSRAARAAGTTRLGTGTRGAALAFERLPFDHPLYVLYSCGTTGAPKCIVHGAGGTLLQHLEGAAPAPRPAARERLFYFTTCGWMMWNWLASGLAWGATLLLYDGSPSHPEIARAVRRGRRASASRCSARRAKFIDAVAKVGRRAARARTTSARARDPVDGLAALARGLRLRLRATSRRTRSSPRSRAAPTSCRASCSAVPWRRSGAARSRCAGLGMAVDVFDDAGRPLRGRQGRARLHAPVPVDADRLLERPRRRALPQGLLRALPGRLVPRRLRRVDRARRHAHPRPQRRGAEPGRRADRHRGDLPPGGAARRRWSSRSRSRRTGRATCAWCCSCACATGVVARRRAAGADPRARESGATPAPRARADRAGGRHPAHAQRQDRRARGARRRARPRGEERGALANPEALEHFRNIPELAA